MASLVTQMVKHLQCMRPGFDPWVRNIPRRRKRQPIPVFLHRKSRGQRSLVGYSPRDCQELGMTEWLTLFMTWFVLLYLRKKAQHYKAVFHQLKNIIRGKNIIMPSLSSTLSWCKFSFLSFLKNRCLIYFFLPVTPSL